MNAIAEKLGSSNVSRIYLGSQEVWSALPSDMIAHWKLDDEVGDTAIDSSGSADLVLVNAPIWTDGKFGGALDFPLNPYAYTNDLPPIGDYYSLSLWAKTSVMVGTGDSANFGFTLAASAPGGANYPLWLLIRDGSVRIMTWSNSLSLFYATNSQTISLGVWHHICVVTTRGGTTKLFVDGVPLIEYTNLGTMGMTYQFSLATLRPGREIYYNGLIDDVRLFDRLLSPDEVMAHATA